MSEPLTLEELATAIMDVADQYQHSPSWEPRDFRAAIMEHLRAVQQETEAKTARECAELPQPPARLPHNLADHLSAMERLAYRQAWEDYAAAIRRKYGLEEGESR